MDDTLLTPENELPPKPIETATSPITPESEQKPQTAGKANETGKETESELGKTILITPAELVKPTEEPANSQTNNVRRGLAEYARLDWTKTDAQLAREMGVSRQRMAQVRKEIREKREAGINIEDEKATFDDIPTPAAVTPQAASVDISPMAKTAADYKLMAETLFDMGSGTLTMVFGQEWQPRILQVGESKINERDLVSEAIAKYLAAKQVEDLPPGMMLTFVLCSYAAPRVTAPNTKTKLVGVWFKIKAFGAKLFKRKAAAIVNPNSKTETTLPIP